MIYVTIKVSKCFLDSEKISILKGLV